MANTRATFKSADVTRAVKGALATDLAVARVDVDPRTGKIAVFFGGATPMAEDDAVAQCDRLLPR